MLITLYARRIAELERKKKAAMMEEDFERCASIRDQITTVREHTAAVSASLTCRVLAVRLLRPLARNTSRQISAGPSGTAPRLRPDRMGGCMLRVVAEADGHRRWL